MKTAILTAAMALMSITGMAQMDSIYDYYRSISVDAEQADYEDWGRVDKKEGSYDGAVMIMYEPTAVSYKKTLGYAIQIVDGVGHDFNYPDKDDSFWANYVDGLFDYNSMNTSLRLESGFIDKEWLVTENDAIYNIIWTCSKKAYAVVIFKYVNE